MSKFPAYRERRSSFGLNVLGTLIIEVEAEDGTVGFGVTTGGQIGAWIAETHFARFVEGQDVSDVETIWEQMFKASLFYGRRGIVLNVISAIDLAIWDLTGKLRDEPVWHLLGGKAQSELTFYAATPRPDIARSLGFIGAKMPLPFAGHGCHAGSSATTRCGCNCTRWPTTWQPSCAASNCPRPWRTGR